MCRILIFDFDGVLADSLDPMLVFARQVCHEMGYTRIPIQEDLEALERMEFAEYGRQLGIAEELIPTFVRRNFELFSQRDEPLEIFPGMEGVIKQLSQSAILAVVTGNSCQVVEKFIFAYGLTGAFETILANEDIGSRLDKILAVKAEHNVSGEETYIIGDAVSDIRAAHDAGIKSVAVGWGHQSGGKLSAETPNFFVDRPEDLLVLFS
jgi:phosphoglycolate phosphatase-like HAD superfamily hydrolase